MMKQITSRMLLRWIGLAGLIPTILGIAISYRYHLETSDQDNFELVDCAFVTIADGTLECSWIDNVYIPHHRILTNWRILRQSSSFPGASFFRLPAIRPCLTGCVISGTTIRIPGWIPLGIFAIPTVLTWRGDRRPPPGHCPRCRYNLTGNTTGVCPECGRKIYELVK